MENKTLTSNTAVLILLILIAGVASLSLFVLSKESLRLDEAQSLWQTSHSPSTLLYIVAQDVHVPLYHLLLYTWEYFFGNGVVTSRALSLIFFIGSLPLVYALGERLYNRRVAIFATVLFALSPFMNWYGNEIRMYSLLVFITLLNQFFFVKIFKQKSSNAWFGYGLTAVIGVYVHYFFFLTLITQALFYFTQRHVFPLNTLKRFSVVAAVIIAALAPWLVYIRSLGNASNTQPLLPIPSTVDFFNTFSQFIIGFQIDPINTIFVSFWPLVVLLIFLALRKTTIVGESTIFLIFSFIIPGVLLFVVSLIFSPAYLSRYLIFTAPAMYLLLSWLFSTYPKPLAFVCRAAVVLLMVAGLSMQVMSANSPAKENYRGAAQYLETHASANDIIVVSAPFTIYPVEYYYRGPTQVTTLPIWDRSQFGPIPVFNEETLPQDIEQLKGRREKLWLLQSYDQGYQEKMRIYFDTHFERLSATEFSHNLNLYEYKLRYD